MRRADNRKPVATPFRPRVTLKLRVMGVAANSSRLTRRSVIGARAARCPKPPESRAHRSESYRAPIAVNARLRS